MFKKGPDIDKKKLLLKALDAKKDSLTRLKHFKTLIELLESDELPSLFKQQYNAIYNTFIDTFSSFDCNSKQRRDDLDCILFMLEKILTHHPESDLLQVFLLNSYNAFVTRANNPSNLDDQVEMCKRIMNIYRFMVMKIYMNAATWKQLLNVMLSITEHLFPSVPPEKKESTIGGRIAPAFFQTFIVSWIRANLYVHISNQMWNEFHRVMRSLTKWRELIEEWSTTMGSLTRVLVKHVYGLNLNDLPLDKPIERRSKPRAMKSFSTAEASAISNISTSNVTNHNIKTNQYPHQQQQHHGLSDLNRNRTSTSSTNPSRTNQNTGNANANRRMRGLTRSNSDGMLNYVGASRRLYISSMEESPTDVTPNALRLRRIKSGYLTSSLDSGCSRPATPRRHRDSIDGSSLKDSNMVIENDHMMIDPQILMHQQHPLGRNQLVEGSDQQVKSKSKQQAAADKCVLLGGSIRGWNPENSVIMWRRMLGLFGNINLFEDPHNHLVAIRCLAIILKDFIKTRENLGISTDNQSTPNYPNLIPPYTYSAGWLLEATLLPRQFKESRIIAYKLLCLMCIRRHDIELPQQFYSAFYEALHRGLTSNDPFVQLSILSNSTQLFTLELPGSTFLINDYLERSRSTLLSPSKELPLASLPRDQSIQILAAILSLHKPIKKLMILKPEGSNSMNLVAAGDVRTKIFSTLVTMNNNRPVALDHQSRLRSLSSMTLHVYQEVSENHVDSPDVDRLFEIFLTDLQETSDNCDFFRIVCDLLRLFADHGLLLATNKPQLVSWMIQTLSHLLVKLSSNDKNKQTINCLLLCLEEWCLAAGKNFLLKPLGDGQSNQHHQAADGPMDDYIWQNESLVTVVLKSLESIISDNEFIPLVGRGASRGSVVGSISTSLTARGFDSHSSSSESNTVDGPRDRTLTNESQRQQQESDISTTGAGGQQTVMDNNSNLNIIESENMKRIKLACKVSLQKLITYFSHFPLKQVGAASMGSYVQETDYLASESELSSRVNFLVIDKTTIISFVGNKRPNHPQSQRNESPGVHLIIRNLCGKYSWEAERILEMKSVELQQPLGDSSSIMEPNKLVVDPDSFQQEDMRSSTMKYELDSSDSTTLTCDGSNSSGSLISSRSCQRDLMEDLMNQLSLSLSNSSSASLSSFHQNLGNNNNNNIFKKRNSATSSSNPKYKIAQAEETMIALLTNQRFQELNYCERSNDVDRVVVNFSTCETPRSSSWICDHYDGQLGGDEREVTRSHLEQTRQMIQHLGYLSWDRRCKIESLTASPRLAREIKNLDSQPIRDTHKIAVIYVANGQEDKNSILSNSTGSRAFEDLVSGLGWEVNLATHLGFRGGLAASSSQPNNHSSPAIASGGNATTKSFASQTSGIDTSVYFCTGTTEIMFHVSTRMSTSTNSSSTSSSSSSSSSAAAAAAATCAPNTTQTVTTTATGTTTTTSEDDESMNRKLRHLGNDEIHIVWSEHVRDYRRGIIPTEFGDVIIVIYPMVTFAGYFRIQILSKPEIPPFGPLFDNCIVHQSCLAPLVRATAANAGRAKRLNLHPHYQSHLEERNRLIEAIVKNHRDHLSFEDFALRLYETTTTSSSSSAGATAATDGNDQQHHRDSKETACCA